MSDLMSFSFFEDPDLIPAIPEDYSTAWKEFFVSETDQHLAPDMDLRAGQGSPDSGVDLFNFDIDNAFMSDNDPVMNPDDLEDEVNFLFKPNLASTGLALDFSIADIDNVFEDEPVNTPLQSSTPTVISESVEADQTEQTSETPNIIPVLEVAEKSTEKIHTYSLKAPRPSRIRSQLSSRNCRSRMSAKKRKMYELNDPLPDPEAEKCRLNAINAKKNRERKKRELEAAEREIHRLRNENSELRNEAENAREELDEARNELEQMKAQLKLAGFPVGKRSKVSF